MTHEHIQTGSQQRAALIPRDPEVFIKFSYQVDDASTDQIPLAAIPDYATRFIGEYREPIGPKDATDHERNPINTAILDIARQAIYAPALLPELYPPLLARTRIAFETGGIKPTREDAGLTPAEMADVYLLSGLGERMAELAGGADKSLFDEQLRTIHIQALALKQNALESEGLREKLRGHVVHSAQARAFLAAKLSPEDLLKYDEIFKAQALAVPESEITKSGENSSGMQRFAEILQHAGFPKGWLRHIPFLTKQPPRSAEVEVVQSEHQAA